MSNLTIQTRREIERRRKAHGITKSELARASKVDLTMLRRFTNGRHGATLAWVGRVYAGLKKLGA